MSYRGVELKPQVNFGGGQNSANPPDTIGDDQGRLVKNIVVLPNGRGIRNRNGDTKFNAVAMNSGANIQGLLYYEQADNDTWLVTVAGAKIYKSDDLDGTMDDITGAVTITSGQNNTFTPFVAEDEAIFVGGAPDAPFKWTGTGNAAALGGSPPSGNFGFYHNNRAFIGNTSANPSRIAWSILADIEDWSGSGSGTADVLTNDGSNLVGASVMDTDRVLLFKQTSIHQMITTTAPFPIFRLFSNVGAVGKHAIVTVDGIAYFITPRGRMMATDGRQIIDDRVWPRLKDIDDVWDGLNSTRLASIHGVFYRGSDFRHIIWHCSNGTSTTNNLAIIWDVDNHCWIQNDTGYDANVATVTTPGVLYGGHYDGFLYQKDVSTSTSDISEGGNGVRSFWKGKWQSYGKYTEIKQIDRININHKTQTVGNLNVRLGSDYIESIVNNVVPMQSIGMKWDQGIWDQDLWGGETDFINTIIGNGVRGQVVTIDLDNGPGSPFRINGISVLGKNYGQKESNIS